MILVALGANEAGPWGSAPDTMTRAITTLAAENIEIIGVSQLYQTAPVGLAGQAAYFNAVAALGRTPPPLPLLALLHRIERDAGRRRGRRWGARSLDIDLLSYHRLLRGWPGRLPAIKPDQILNTTQKQRVIDGTGGHLRWGGVLNLSAKFILGSPPADRQLVLPHPRLHLRPFVAAPLAELVPLWHHPVFGASAYEIWRRLRLARMGEILSTVDNPHWPWRRVAT